MFLRFLESTPLRVRKSINRSKSNAELVRKAWERGVGVAADAEPLLAQLNEQRVAAYERDADVRGAKALADIRTQIAKLEKVQATA